ncbi:unnamed protein product [Rotaria sp. Silwood1]|nr:unnamed protein product [Rotaria sp. Silwood1]
MEELISHESNHVSTQTLGLSIVEEHQKKIEKLQENEIILQHEIKHLIEERDLLSQWKQDEIKKMNDLKISYELAQLQQHSSLTVNSIQSQTSFDIDSSTDLKINEYQSQIDNLLHERITLMEKIKKETFQPSKTDADTQTIKDIDSLPSSSDQNISRHTFEQEMLAWSKESEQLKYFVKQIQIENKKT